MDTIFVKQVKEGGPAHEAGLCTGNTQSALNIFRLFLKVCTFPVKGRKTVSRGVFSLYCC